MQPQGGGSGVGRRQPPTSAAASTVSWATLRQVVHFPPVTVTSPRRDTPTEWPREMAAVSCSAPAAISPLSPAHADRMSARAIGRVR